MLPRVLIVDDEKEVLKAIGRALRSHFDVYLYDDPEKALAFARTKNCHVVISDMKMPSMNGEVFLSKFAKICPFSKRCVLTGHAELEATIALVNEIGIDCYLTKPWDNKELIVTLNGLVREYVSAIKKKKYYQKLKSSNEELLDTKQALTYTIDGVIKEQVEEHEHAQLLEKSNRQLLKLVTSMVSLYNDDNSHHCHRIAAQAQYFMLDKGYSSSQAYQIYLAARLYRVAAMQFSPELINKPYYEMKIHQKKQWFELFGDSADILSNVDALHAPTETIRLLFSGEIGKSSNGDNVEGYCYFGAKLLTHLIAIDLLVQGKVKKEKLTPFQAFSSLRDFIARDYDAVLAKYISSIFLNPSSVVCEIPVHAADLKEGMVVAESYYNDENHKIVGQDKVLTVSMIEGIMNYQENRTVPVVIYIKGMDEDR